ncbi:hypothetical protein PR202_ga31629 [Eleusine coracana subsp. coracana]|uniref:Uncharacterized protein n=1 Tax=Eleusine coracana subsp. coracana TaxID=191504 RepID=A0AAV5DSD5_ELECO|nr:hypothetical protein PR202_ga31629 [Eleusine coracana subsp. coracana]
MAKKSKAAGAAAPEEMDVSSPQGSAHGSEGSGEKEGSFLLGQPTWEDAGGGGGEKLEEKMASGEMAEGEAAKSNEPTKKTKSKKKDRKKSTVVSPTAPREPKPEMDDSDDPDFWVPPVGSRTGGGDDDDDMVDKDDAESRELASRTKRMTLEAVGPSSFASRKKKPKKDE